MPDRVDYKLDQNFDIGFTDWNDIETIHDDRVLTQNFVLLAAENGDMVVGEQVTETLLHRFRKRLESSFRDRDEVDYFSVNDLEIDGRDLTYSITVGSDEYVETVRIP